MIYFVSLIGISWTMKFSQSESHKAGHETVEWISFCLQEGTSVCSDFLLELRDLGKKHNCIFFRETLLSQFSLQFFDIYTFKCMELLKLLARKVTLLLDKQYNNVICIVFHTEEGKCLTKDFWGQQRGESCAD